MSPFWIKCHALIVYWIFETHPTHPSNIVVVYVLRMIKPCDLDKGDDMNHCVDSRMPVMTHEICANVAYTAVVPTCFFIQMFPSHSVIFVEERFMYIGADSRDFVTKKYNVPNYMCHVLPMDKNGTQYVVDGYPSTKFSEKTWNIIKKCNPGCGKILQDHVLQGKADPPYEEAYPPTYYFWRTTTKSGGKIRELHPVIVPELHRHFHRKTTTVDWVKQPKFDRPRPDDKNKYWFEIEGFAYDDIHEWKSGKPAAGSVDKYNTPNPKSEMATDGSFKSYGHKSTDGEKSKDTAKGYDSSKSGWGYKGFVDTSESCKTPKSKRHKHDDDDRHDKDGNLVATWQKETVPEID